MVLILRLLLGLLTLAAIGIQFGIHVRSGFDNLNFFSYFTNLANLFAALLWIWGAVVSLAKRELPPAYDKLRALSAVNMTVVGIVFSVLLRDVDLGALLPWVNSVLHTVMPCAVLLEWLLQPPQFRLGKNQILFCQIFPAIYLAYTLIRGAMVGWYPYPFLNPSVVGGYAAVAGYSIGIAATFLLVSWGLFAINNSLRPKSD